MTDIEIAQEIITAAQLLAAKGEVPEAFKKEWKNDDKDGDGKENEPKPDFLKKKEKKASDTYTFYADPGHAWLAVTREEIDRLGIARKISQFSYQKGDIVYLEEDGDAGVFLNAKKKNGERFSIREKHTDNDSPIRNMRSFHASEHTAGCEKLPEGPMRDNCEKKKKAGEIPGVPDGTGPKGKGNGPGKGKADGSGKENEPKPDFLKKKEAAKVPAEGDEIRYKGPDGEMTVDTINDVFGDEVETKYEEVFEQRKLRWRGRYWQASTEAPKGVVAAMTADGKIELFAAETPKAASSIKSALQDKGGYTRIASGPNADRLSSDELYAHFEERWAGCEKLPEGGMRDNCEKKKEEGKKKDD